MNDLNETHKKANYSCFFVLLTRQTDRLYYSPSLSFFFTLSALQRPFVPSRLVQLFPLSGKQEEIKSLFVALWKISYIRKVHFKKVSLCQNLNGMNKEDKNVQAEIKFIKFALFGRRYEGEMDDVQEEESHRELGALTVKTQQISEKNNNQEF